MRCAALIATLALLGTLACAGSAAAAEDPYLAWREGRPIDAERELLVAVHGGDRDSWAAWYDCARAARACGDPGVAMACLWEAHRLAPRQRAPLAALRAGGAALGPTWCERLAPLAWCADAWAGPVLAMLGGCALALAAMGRISRRWIAPAALALALVAVGLAALEADARAPYAVVRVASALQGIGAARTMLPAGTLVRLAPRAPSSHQVLATAADGARGWIAEVDLGPGRAP